MATALYPGSFDPIHNGHLAVIETVAEIFESIVVAVASNSRKSGSIPISDRAKLIEDSVAHLPNVDVTTFSGLTAAAATKIGAACIVKGVRNTSDFNDEMAQASVNAATGNTATGNTATGNTATANSVAGNTSGPVKTLFVPGFGRYGLLSSRFIIEIAAYGGDVSSCVPPNVVQYFNSSNPLRQA